MNQSCARAEILAGAIALGEANETERDEYRRHISGCAECLASLGGEREIERVMQTVADARESEVWAPAPVRATVRRPRWKFAFGVGGSVLAAALVASFGIHSLIAATVPPVQVVAQAQEQTSPTTPFHVSLEHRAKAQMPAQAKVAVAPVRVAPSMVVVRHVITLEKNKIAQTTTVAKSSDAGKNDPVVTVPAVQTQTQTQDIASAQTTTQSPVLGGHAESIAVAPSYIIRDVTPVGGVTAINPKPAPIAYAQGAEGTTAFEVAVDERGTPTKCTITKGSGYAALDVSVCKAAMAARYQPRTINGKPVASVYRDAFTFHNNNNGDQLIPE